MGKLDYLIVKGNGLDRINLMGTTAAKYYKGAGNAFLIVENNEPQKIIYENDEFPLAEVDLTVDDIFELFVNHKLDFSELKKSGGIILSGMCSNYQFCMPDVFIDLEEEFDAN